MAQKKTVATMTREQLKASVAKEFSRITASELWESKDGKKFRYYVDCRKVYGTKIACKVWYNPVAVIVETKYQDAESLESKAKLEKLVKEIAKELSTTGKCTIKPIVSEKINEEVESDDALF